MNVKFFAFWNVMPYSLAARVRPLEDPAALIFVVGEDRMLVVSSHVTRRLMLKDCDVSISAVSEL
jgi:hypothetical protein